MVSYQAADSTLGETRWAKTDSHERRQLPREALKEYIARLRDLVEATDRLIALLSEPGFDANIARFIKLAKARGERFPKVDLSPDAWRLLRRIYAGGYQVHVLTEAHWEDWVANPFPEPAKASPWQKEVLALVNDIQIAEKEHDALLDARGAGGASPKPTSKPTNAPEHA